MKEVVIKKKKLKVTIDGESYLISYPSRKHAKAFGATAKGENEDYEIFFTILEELGLPIEAVDLLTLEDAATIFKSMTSAEVKKN